LAWPKALLGKGSAGQPSLAAGHTFKQAAATTASACKQVWQVWATS